MGDKTGIEWTDATWNPTSGCSKVSQGCKNCYAERVFPRPYPGRKFTDVRTHEDRLTQPLRWARPRRIFVNSMSDLFHEDVPFEFVDRVFAIMALAPRHTFQVLTKRPERMRVYLSQNFVGPRIRGTAWGMLGYLPKYRHENVIERPWPLPNVWLGVSVEDQQTADERIPLLLRTPAATRFLSCEPLLGSVNLRPVHCRDFKYDIDRPASLYALEGVYQIPSCHSSEPFARVDWVIAGGESGPKARPMHPAWARSMRDQCAAAGVPFFFKQHGEWLATDFCNDDMAMLPSKRTVYVRRDGTFHDGSAGVDFFGGDQESAWVGKKAAGRLLDGRTWDQFPAPPVQP